MTPMQRRLVVGLVSLLGWWPLAVMAGESGQKGGQRQEQQQLLTRDQIQQIQERLKAEGVDPGPVNGVMNAQTQAALRKYQQKQGLPVSGAVDDATLRQLQLPIETDPERGGGGCPGGRPCKR
jgi:hypothetical protein